MAWPTTSDGQYYIFDGQILLPVDASTGAPILMLRPQGGMGQAIPAIEKGDPGVHAQIDPVINYTPLEYDDPTPDAMSWTVITPPTSTTPGVYKLNSTIRKGEKGDDGGTTLDPTDYGTPTYKKMLVVNSATTGFELQSQKVSDRRIPATLNNTASGNPNSTLGVIAINTGEYDFDWRPRVRAYTIVNGEAADVRVDLIARLNGETGGNIVGRCTGIAQTDRLILTAGPPAGSADTFDKVAANAAATIHLRCERQSGSVTYTTSASTTLFSVDICPVP